MDHKHRTTAFPASTYHDDDPQTSSEHSGEESRPSTASALSPKKGRRGIHKRVVSVPYGDVDGSRSGGGKGEAYPPSDSWAWRKYGQKPIKGSPYPRGYYRCSSSKGCPARKQVERSHVDPSVILVTYAGDHSHSIPNSKNNHHNTIPPPTPTPPATPTPSDEPLINISPDIPTDIDATLNAEAEDFGLEDGNELYPYSGLDEASLVDFSWLADVSIEAPSFVGPRFDDADVAMLPVSLTMREEDESLFADLDELPECSAVFMRGRGISTCNLGPTPAPPLCTRTG